MRKVQAPQAKCVQHARALRPRAEKAARDPAVRALRDPLAQKLAPLGRVRSYGTGRLLIRENEPAQELFVVLAGGVMVFVADADGREMVLGQYGPGACLGEMALEGQRRCASVRALEPTVCAVVKRKTLRRALSADPQLAMQLLATVSGRVRGATAVVKSLALSNVYRRVSDLLLSLEYEEIDGGRWSRETFRQLDIANRVGASRDMISKVLKELRLGGYIAMRDRRITILRQPPARW
ncbi:MAG TPA: Crp/Fnr family transcriptional regulator [Burkholderiaceae bacterium]|nr:Crp/Fnr family transcriptional regulator [Burkholderiaceae bacterium]